MPKVQIAKTLKEHKKFWKNCTLCDLSICRKRVVTYRGSVPCDVLFIGEGPGDGEDVLGKPFVGEAGKFLDRMIKRAIEESGISPKLGFTNMVGCLPKDPETNEKIGQPTKQQIRACTPRLQEIIEIAQPKKIVAVGKVARENILPYVMDLAEGGHVVSITHPAAILKQMGSNTGKHANPSLVLVTQKDELCISDLFRSIE